MHRVSLNDVEEHSSTCNIQIIAFDYIFEYGLLNYFLTWMLCCSADKESSDLQDEFQHVFLH